MENLPITDQNSHKIVMPFQEFLNNQEHFDLYCQLVKSISEIFNEGQELKSRNRSSLWINFLKVINQFIYNSEINSVVFERCLAAGSLIFTLKSNKMYILSKLAIVQELFQLFQKKPSHSQIFKKLGQLSELKINDIEITNQFQKFLNDFNQQFPNSKCNQSWSLYEIKYELLDTCIFNSSLLINNINDLNEKILDSIIDDSSDIFTLLITENSNKFDNLNQNFYLNNYKLPKILLDNPTYASLCCFFQAEKCLSILCKLIKGGLNSKEIQKVDENGRTLIHFACNGENVRIIDILFKAGYDLNQKDNDGFTPSHYSAMFGSLSIFQYLIQNGANIFSSYSFSGMTPFQIACVYGNLQIIKFIDELTSGDFIKNDLSFNNSMQNSLILACINGHDNIISYLLHKLNEVKNKIANINSMLYNSLYFLCKNGNANCIKLIFQSQVFRENPMCIKNKISNLIEIAAFRGHLSVIKLFCLQGIIDSYADQKVSSLQAHKELFQMKNIGEENSSDDISIKRHWKSHIKESDNNFRDLLTDEEKNQIDSIYSHFQQKSRISNAEYYSLINALSKINFHDGFLNVQCCAASGIIPSFYNTEFDGKPGTVIAINAEKISDSLNKSWQTFSMSFLKQSCVLLTMIQAQEMLQQTTNKIFSYYNILYQLGYNFKFYFVFAQQIEYEIPNFASSEKHINSNQVHSKKKFPNNAKYLKAWRFKKKQLEQIHTYYKLLRQWKAFAKHFHDSLKMMNDIINQDSAEDSNDYIGNELNINQIDETKLYDISMDLLSKLKSLILQNSLNNSHEKGLLLEDFLDKIYSNGIQKETAHKIIKDVLEHQKNQTWKNTNTLKFAFLMKFCSSSSYYRLFKCLNEKIPSGSTVDSRFRAQIIEREKALKSSEDVTVLLDQYWNDIKNKVDDYLNEFNKTFSTDINSDEFKIKICIGCDAASFTSFTKEKKKTKEESAHTKKSTLKNDIFAKLVNGDFNSEDITGISNDEESGDSNDFRYFFTLLLQPFSWKFPVSVIHLTKSLNGHFSDKEALDVFKLIKLINSHQHFEVVYFAADGETALDSFHEYAFNQYEDKIDDLLNGKITFESFYEYVRDKCKILPILDMFHSEKNGRNRIMNNDINLGDEDDIITLDTLRESLDIQGGTLNDTSTIGRMKDAYPIDLFQLKNSIHEFEQRNNSSAFYIFIYSIILEVFRNPYLDLELRHDLSKIVLSLLLLLYKESFNLPEGTGFRKNAKSQNKYVWFTERNNLIKLINTMIALCTILNNPQTSFMFGLERISSHPVEQFFGRYRSHICGFYTPKNAFRYTVKTSLALDFESDLGISFSIPKRENYGGVHLDYDDDKEKETETALSPDNFKLGERIKDIVSDLFSISKGEKKELDEFTQDFLITLSYFFEKNHSYRSKSLSATKGSGIVPRLVANGKRFKKKKKSKK